MQQPDYLILARILHIAGVVVWIGGVAFVTTVLIPSLKKMEHPQQRLALFEQLEGRFADQARIVTLITGVSGLYMLGSLEAWDRYQHLEFWWMHLMTFVWAMFVLVLFFLEPIFLHNWFHTKALEDNYGAFSLIYKMHVILTTLSVLAIIGAVAGAHGIQFS